MAQRARRSAVSLAETLDLHARHEQALTAIGSNYANGIAPTTRRQLLRIAHQKQQLLQRAGVLPSRSNNPLIGEE